MKPIKIKDENIIQAIYSGDNYIQVKDKKFLLLEVNEVDDPKVYIVTDSEEEDLLLQSINGVNPILSEEEINKILGEQK